MLRLYTILHQLLHALLGDRLDISPEGFQFFVHIHCRTGVAE